MPERRRVTAAIFAAALFLTLSGCGTPASSVGIPLTEQAAVSAEESPEMTAEDADDGTEKSGGPVEDPDGGTENSGGPVEDPDGGTEGSGGSAETRKPVETSAGGSDSPCVVFVCGAVKNPGLYTLEPGSRAGDAVKAAGGFADDADTDFCNLAETVADGEKIRILTKQEAETADAGAGGGLRTEGGAGNSRAGENPAGGESGTGGAGISGEKTVNINTAAKEELMTLPGIGEAKAEAILRYREEQGPFTSPEDVMLVPGIKEGAYAKLRGRITVK